MKSRHGRVRPVTFRVGSGADTVRGCGRPANAQALDVDQSQLRMCHQIRHQRAA